jgi:hypothetical protein
MSPKLSARSTAQLSAALNVGCQLFGVSRECAYRNFPFRHIALALSSVKRT